MNFKDAISFLIIFFFLPTLAFTQANVGKHSISCEIPEVALVGLVSDNGSDLMISAIAPTEAGNSIDDFNSDNNKIWINYSSIITNENHRRKIIGMISGELPKGIRIKVQASEVLGFGKGSRGNPSGEVFLTNEPSDIITNIGSCYTGKGTNNGHVLTYKLEIDESEYSSLVNKNESINIVYTLTDQN